MKQLISPEPYTVRVGNDGVLDTWRFKGRTIEQFEALRKITSRPDFDFSTCSNPFEVGCKGAFWFIWYDKSDNMHTMRITPKGRVKELEV